MFETASSFAALALTPAQQDTALRAAASAAEEARLTADVLLVVEALAAGLYQLREAQRAAADARDAHLRTIGSEPPVDERGLGPFYLASGVRPLIGRLLAALTRPGSGASCRDLTDDTRHGDVPLLYLPPSVAEATPLNANLLWQAVEGEAKSPDDRPLDDYYKSRIARTVPIAIFTRVVALLRGEMPQ